MGITADIAFEIMAKNCEAISNDSAFGVTKWSQFVAAAFHEGKIDYYREHIEDMLTRKYAWSFENARKASAELERSIIFLRALQESGNVDFVQ